MAIKKSKHFFEEDFVEKIGEVSDEKYKPLPPNKELKFIGKKIPRYDGYNKVNGKAVYTFDINLPNMVYGKILRSNIPHAKIKSIDISKAKNIDGVLEILTFENTQEYNWYGNTSKLFDQHLRYEGDEIACVCATSQKIAEEAVKKIIVSFAKLPFEVDAEKSLKSENLKIHEAGNISREKPDEYSRGNIDAGFEQSEVILEDTFTTQIAIHNPTEVHCSVVNWEGEKLKIWDSTQGIFEVRNSIAKSLGLKEENVQVIKEYMGGGFGSKLEAGKYTLMASLLAKKLKRPVKIVLDRKEMNLAVGNRPDSKQTLKVGVKKDGTILALSHHSIANVGAYPSGGGCSWPARSMYQIPNVKTVDYSIFTNTGRGRAFRAPGHVQGTFALDSILDDVAEKIVMDPLEFRIKNYAEKDQVWGASYTSKKLREAYKIGAEKIGWKDRNKIPGKVEGYLKTGIGMASQIWWGGGGPPAHANMKISKDGIVNVYSGTQDIGTGTYTFISQIAAEILEIPLEKIKVHLGNTDYPFGPSSGGSTTAPSISPAVRDAAEKMKRKLFSAASALTNISEDRLDYSEGVFSSENKNLINIDEIAKQVDDEMLFTKGSREENVEGLIAQTFGAQFAKVEVDILTGNVKVKKIVAAHDTGRILNRQTLENQYHGGIMQGLGFALTEERIMDSDYGKMLNPNMHDYKIPTMLDAPDEIEIIIVTEMDELANNMGVKGIGEPAIIPTAAAIANAVYNAIGVRIKSLPITPDKILNALYKN
ncbi:MAG: xanthine dehydrogenase family protein molybdopterin-binding subunit [Ignavibacteriae bacterium]|nr:xanthine dehydrogenase family protein molybdopterin-binding subunit [Ignavibacteriota bacterium]